MTDTRFTTLFEDVTALLEDVDVDEVGDIETLLMFVFARPMGVEEAYAEDGSTGLDIVAYGEQIVGSVLEFPMNLIDLTRFCTELVANAGPYVSDGTSEAHDAPNIAALADDELIPVLQDALGKVRLFNLMEDDG